MMDNAHFEELSPKLRNMTRTCHEPVSKPSCACSNPSPKRVLVKLQKILQSVILKVRPLAWSIVALLLFDYQNNCRANDVELRTAETAFDACRYEDQPSGQIFSYRLLKPPLINSRSHYPLILFLHGAGGRGNDNLANMRLLAPIVTQQEFQRDFPCYVLIPQCPTNLRWESFSREVFGMLDEVMAQNKIDTNRVYLTGYSMGGQGCWHVAAMQPERFAALVSVAGRSEISLVSRLTELPTWVVHGDADDVVSVNYSREMVDALKAAGGNCKYTEVKGAGHDSWRQAYGPEGVFPWMFRQSSRGRWWKRNWLIIVFLLIDTIVAAWLLLLFGRFIISRRKGARTNVR